MNLPINTKKELIEKEAMECYRKGCSIRYANFQGLGMNISFGNDGFKTVIRGGHTITTTDEKGNEIKEQILDVPPKECVPYFKKAIKLFLKIKDYYWVARCLHHLGLFKEAIKYYKIAMKNNPKNTNACISYINTAMEMKYGAF